MVGKAVVYKTKTDKLIELNRNSKELFALNRSRISIQQVQISPGGATPSSAGDSGGVGNFLETQGDTMIGPIAFNPKTVQINADGRIGISETDRNSPNSPLSYSSYIFATGLGSPDDLRFIDGAAYSGQLLYLQGTATQIINIKHATLPSITSISGTGTVSVTTGTDHNLTTGETVNILSTTNFDVQSVAVTVTGATTFTYSDAGNATPESSGLVQDGNIVTPTGTTVVLDGSVGINTVPVATLLFDVQVQGNGAWRVVSGGDSSNIPDGTAERDHLEWNSGAWVAHQDVNFDNDTEGLRFRNFIDSAYITFKATTGNNILINRADGGNTGLEIYSDDTVNPQNLILKSFAAATGTTAAIGNTGPKTRFDVNLTSTAFHIEDVGAGVIRMNLNQNSVEEIKDVRFDLSASYTLANTEAGIGYDDDVVDRLIYNTPSGTKHTWMVNGIEEMTLSNVALQFPNNIQIICTPTTSLSGINVGSVAQTSLIAPVNGDIHYDSLTGKFRFYQNGAYAELGGALTPWTSDIDADGWDLNDLSNILFRNTTATPTTNVHAIWADGGGLKLQTAATNDAVNIFLSTDWVLSFKADGEILWANDGHTINPQAASLDFGVDGTTDAFIFKVDVTATPEDTVRIEDDLFRIQGDTFQTLEMYNEFNAASGGSIAGLSFHMNNSGGVKRQYADITGIVVDASTTLANTKGGLQFLVTRGGGNSVMFAIEGNSSQTNSTIGFYNKASLGQGTGQQTVTGSRGGNAALASVLTALHNLGLIVDSST